MFFREFSFPSADQKTDIHAVEWTPEGTARGILVLSHGIAEHILRYAPLAQRLTAAGFVVTGHDHLGHGGSVGPEGAYLYAGGEGSWQWMAEDLYTARCLAMKRHPDLPCFLLGHSMGSFIARTYLIRYPDTVDGAIIMGTGQIPAPLVAAGQVLAKAELQKRGEQGRSPIIGALAFGQYNRRFAPNRTPFDWLSSIDAQVDRYIADPLCGGNPTTRLFSEMMGGIAFITKTANLRGMNLYTPVLFLSGEQDPLGSGGRGVAAAMRSFQGVGVRDVSMKLYPGCRHEILNDTAFESVCEDIKAWMEQRLVRKGAGQR